jgi:hypothetical protein
VDSGELRESHTLELKRDDYPVTEGGRRELAKDIAALAVDGGTLIIGVDEDKVTGRSTSLTPIPVLGVAERIDQITAYRVDPPLPVEIRDDLRDPDDSARGLVLVEVPASPQAPHMVDGRYCIRDNRTVRAMSDAEVVRHHQLRARDTDVMDAELAAAVDTFSATIGSDPGRLVAIAVPIPVQRPHALRAELSGHGASQWLDDRQKAATERARAQVDASATDLKQQIYRNWEWYVSGSRHGVRVTNGVRFEYFAGQTRTFVVEVAESGTVGVAAAHLVTSRDHRAGAGTRPEMDQLRAMTITLHTIVLAAEIADQMGSRGTIGIGVAFDGVKDAWLELVGGPDAANPMKWMQARDRLAPYRDANYRQTTMATTTELSGDLTPVIDRLFGSLLRSVGLGDPLHTT